MVRPRCRPRDRLDEVQPVEPDEPEKPEEGHGVGVSAGIRRVLGASAVPVAVLGGLQLMDQAGQSAYAVLVPNIRDAFGISDSAILSITAAAAAAALLCTLPVAFLADRTRRVGLALGGAVLWSGFSIGLGLAPGVVVAGVMLALASMGQAVIFPTNNSLLADYYPVRARSAVYSLHRAALSLGAVLGVLAGAGLADASSWRTPFLVFPVLTLTVVALGAWRLREPARGAHEEEAFAARGGADGGGADGGGAARGGAAGGGAALAGGGAAGRAAGAAGPAGAARDVTLALETASAAPEAPVLDPSGEPPASLREAWRLVWKVRTLRRIFVALPFLAAAIVGFTALASLQYQRTFHLDAFHRAVLIAPIQVFDLAGLVLGAWVGTRLASRRAGAVFPALGVAAVAAAGFLVLFALAPSVPWAFAGQAGVELSLVVVGPGALAALSLVIPGRVRALGFSLGALFVLPGLVVVPIVGGVGDALSLRYGLLVMVPVFLVGAAIIATAGRLVDLDLADVWTGVETRRDLLRARRAGRLPLLVLRRVRVGYGDVVVVDGLDLRVDAGEIVALLGTNGAGKSTVLRAVTGLVEAEDGVIAVDGRDVTHLPPDEIAKLGVSQVPGGAGIFPELTVGENLRAATWQVRRHRREVRRRTDEALERFPVLRDRFRSRAGDLSGGQQQMLALAMALSAGSKVLLVDELSLGLAPSVVEELLSTLRRLASRGMAVVVVEQSVNVALSVADRAYVMDQGTVVFDGSTEELARRPEILRSAYLHRARQAAEPLVRGEDSGAPPSPDSSPRPAGPVAGRPGTAEGTRGPSSPAALELSEVTVNFGGILALDQVSLTVEDGTIVGIVGPNGAGKTTLADVVTGIVAPAAGRVRLYGRDVTAVRPSGRARAGLGRSFQAAPLFPDSSVRETLAVALERFVEGAGPVSSALRLPAAVLTEAAVDETVERLVTGFGLARFAGVPVRELSTGTRRLVELAAVVAQGPRVLVLDEPCSGLAQREVEQLGGLLRSVRRRLGCTMVVVEHDVAFVRSLVDRLVFLDQGAVRADGTPGEVLDDPAVTEAFLGTGPVGRQRSGAAS